MPKTNRKTEIRIEVNIKQVKMAEVTPATRQLYKRFWTKLAAQAQDEAKMEACLSKGGRYGTKKDD